MADESYQVEISSEISVCYILHAVIHAAGEQFHVARSHVAWLQAKRHVKMWSRSNIIQL